MTKLCNEQVHRYLVGDAQQVLQKLPDESVHCVVTSPPYWNLRDYRVKGQIGLEASPERYIERLVQVFDEVRRVLRKDGTLWLNIGDCWNSRPNRSGRSFRRDRAEEFPTESTRGKVIPRGSGRWGGGNGSVGGLKDKDLVGIPYLLAFALQSAGWWWRQAIIWSKPNVMPSSQIDRCTQSHEYVMLFSKRAKYFFDYVAISERTKPVGSHPSDSKPSPNYSNSGFGIGRRSPEFRWRYVVKTGMKRSVWTITVRGYQEAHFATFPEDLVKPCILAGTSERGCCPKCGAPWERVVEKAGGTTGTSWHDHRNDLELGQRGGTAMREGFESYEVRTAGWRPTCVHYNQQYRLLMPRAKSRRKQRQHDAARSWWKRARKRPAPFEADTEPAIVLDPFAGSGTTGRVAEDLGRDWVLIDINSKYAGMAGRRTAQVSLKLKGGSVG